MNHDTIQCVFSVDDGYCQHLAVALASLLTNNQTNRLDLTLLHGGLSEHNQDRLRTVVSRHSNARLMLRRLDEQSFGHLPEVGHLTVATYFRLFLQVILPPDVKKVIYIDADTAVVSDVRELWETDLDGCAVAAVPEYWKIHHERLGLPDDVLHFNSGVMLIDLDYWRSENLLPKFLRFIEENAETLLNGDQDAMNVVLMRRVRFISCEWNYQTYMRYFHVNGSGMSDKQFNEIASSPRIVHYAGRRKPWRYRDDVRHEAIYLRYIKKTPWRSFKQPDKTLRAVLRRHIKRRAPRTLAIWVKLRDRFRSGVQRRAEP